MTDDEYQPVAVSRRICAPAHDIFQALADPVRHPDFDGSDMLRGATSAAAISGVGDVFVMKMYFARIGDYEMNNHVVEYEQDRRIGWEPQAGHGYPSVSPDSPQPARTGQRWSYQLVPDGPDATVVTEIYDCSRVPKERRAGMDNGRMWIDSMTRTLERLDALCAPRKAQGLSGAGAAAGAACMWSGKPGTEHPQLLCGPAQRATRLVSSGRSHGVSATSRPSGLSSVML
jgi:hypothetical protein